MKLTHRIAAIALIVVPIFNASAQTKTTSKPTISDDDLRRYAITLDSINVMQKTLIDIITENVQKNTVMTVHRYNELNKLGGDQAKLASANATQNEIDFLNEIAELKKYNTARINSVYQSLAKDYVGLKEFNSIKKSVATDPSLKSRLENITEEIMSTHDTASNRGQ
jgi:hypothetical protein